MNPTEQRLALLEARLALLELEGRYALVWDSGDAEGWADLFTSDGVFEMAALGERPGARHEGRVALRDFCAGVNGRFRGIHMLHLPTFTIEAERATGSLHFQYDSGRLTPEAHEIASVTGSTR